ncbi:hypothetical protein ACFX1R_022162 [Malus domestica]
MASRSSQNSPSYESGDGIATLRHLLNGLHRPRAGLHPELFFEMHGVQSLGPAWISRVPSVVEDNMPRGNWFTPNPYLAGSSISSSKWSLHRRGFPLMNDPTWAQWVDELEPFFKQKWMSNGIYELLVLSKTSIVPKPELLTSALIFWNTSTNTFDFSYGSHVSHHSRYGPGLRVEAVGQDSRCYSRLGSVFYHREFEFFYHLPSSEL